MVSGSSLMLLSLADRTTVSELVNVNPLAAIVWLQGRVRVIFFGSRGGSGILGLGLVGIDRNPSFMQGRGETLIAFNRCRFW